MPKPVAGKLNTQQTKAYLEGAAEPRSENAAADVKPRTLAVDIGGTGIKAQPLDRNGKPIKERERIPTPSNAIPKKVVAIVRKLAEMQRPFERVSVGFPGVIKKGVIYTAPNLGKGWNNFKLESVLAKKLKCPVRIANDADVQALGSVSGHGLELVITLGTGFGSVVFIDGHRIHLELGHHPFHKGKTYEDELGHRALEKKGKKKWNRLLGEAIGELARTFNYDRLYIGGGDTKYIKIKLPSNVKIVSNLEGLLGGIKLWEPGSAVEKPAAAPRKIRAVPAPNVVSSHTDA
ncbi:MAG TPA: ROK family protein [Candidatus Binataceae bacterium]